MEHHGGQDHDDGALLWLRRRWDRAGASTGDARAAGEAHIVEQPRWPRTAAPQVPFVKELVQDLGDTVVDRVAEAGQELLVGPGRGLGDHSTSLRIFCRESFCSRR